MLKLFLAGCIALAPAAAQAVDDLLDPEKAFRFSARMIGRDSIEVRYEIAHGYYLYRDRFNFVVEGAKAGQALIPEGRKKFDPHFHKTVETHRGSVVIQVPVSGISRQVVLKATSQGCADAGVCYPPVTQSARLVGKR